MRLKNIIATAHPAGNQIILRWINPNPDLYPSVCIRRREITYPNSPDDGVLVTEGTDDLHDTTNRHGERVYTFLDKDNLKGETVYYYSLFPYENKGTLPTEPLERNNCTAAMATAPYDMAQLMYTLLPRIYPRYDTVLPPDTPGMSEADQQRGQLRRFLELPGNQLDQFYSCTKSMRELHNIDTVDARLLPLLGQTIGWPLNNQATNIDNQRNEIRSAPFLYQTNGIIPTVETVVKRVYGLENRVKEFVHNVFMSNSPERLNIWMRQQIEGQWSNATEPFSLDFAYEGRLATAYDKQKGTLWLFYQTYRNERWEIWYKTHAMFSIVVSNFPAELDNDFISPILLKAFKEQGLTLFSQASIEKQGKNEWLITDFEHKETYRVKKNGEQLNIERASFSQPLVATQTGTDKHPTAIIQGTTLWVFWDAYDKDQLYWRIHYCTRNQKTGQWSAINTFDINNARQYARRQPSAVADDMGGMGIFWLEKVGSEWKLKYQRHNASNWEDETYTFPPIKGTEQGKEPQSESEPFVNYLPTNGDKDPILCVFWVYTDYDPASQQTRKQIIYRFMLNIEFNKGMLYSWKENQDQDYVSWSKGDSWNNLYKSGPTPTENDWAEQAYLLPPVENADDCDPTFFFNQEGNIELFWASNRDGNWSIWHNTLDLSGDSPAYDNWGTPNKITDQPYSERYPSPVRLPNNHTLLIYRSNQSVKYQSTTYRGTETVDFRYAGCSTVDTRNTAKLNLLGQFQDFQTYTFDTSITGRYARQTIGIYLPDQGDTQKTNRLEKILPHQLPIQVRFLVLEDNYRDLYRDLI